MREKIRVVLLIAIIILSTFALAWTLAVCWSDKKHFKEVKSYINKDGIQIINIRAFGANGRDKKDDSKAIYEALHEAERFSNCESIKGSMIYFPRGIYIIKNTVGVDPGKYGIIMSGIKFDLSDDSINQTIFENIHFYEVSDSILDKPTIISGIRPK